MHVRLKVIEQQHSNPEKWQLKQAFSSRYDRK